MHPFQDLYDRVPRIACKGHCGRDRHNTCCGPIGCTTIEADLIDQYNGQATRWEELRPGEVKMAYRDERHGLFTICPHLAPDGRCKVYDVRPLICRLWGVSAGMPCPWGCEPERVLTAKQACDLLEEASVRTRKSLNL